MTTLEAPDHRESEWPEPEVGYDRGPLTPDEEAPLPDVPDSLVAKTCLLLLLIILCITYIVICMKIREIKSDVIKIAQIIIIFSVILLCIVVMILIWPEYTRHRNMWSKSGLCELFQTLAFSLNMFIHFALDILTFLCIGLICNLADEHSPRSTANNAGTTCRPHENRDSIVHFPRQIPIICFRSSLATKTMLIAATLLAVILSIVTLFVSGHFVTDGHTCLLVDTSVFIDYVFNYVNTTVLFIITAVLVGITYLHASRPNSTVDLGKPVPVAVGNIIIIIGELVYMIQPKGMLSLGSMGVISLLCMVILWQFGEREPRRTFVDTCCSCTIAVRRNARDSPIALHDRTRRTT